jgi:hypothetical protein
VTIKGTLETFNLPDLLQMLAFNQKAGTLVLETAAGARTVCVERGLFGFVQGDLLPSRTAARILRRTGAVASDRLARAEAITANSGRYLGDALTDLGVVDAAQRANITHQAICELAFDLVQTSITRFEFVEGRRLSPSGAEAEAIEPLMPVDGFLIDLTRKLDEWSLLRQEIPTEEEVFERTDLSPDLRELDVPKTSWRACCRCSTARAPSRRRGERPRPLLGRQDRGSTSCQACSAPPAPVAHGAGRGWRRRGRPADALPSACRRARRRRPVGARAARRRVDRRRHGRCGRSTRTPAPWRPPTRSPRSTRCTARRTCAATTSRRRARHATATCATRRACASG